MLKGLNFVMNHVTNLAETEAFYRDLLGLTPVDERPQFVQFAPPNGAGANFAIGVEPDSAAVELWWETDDVDTLHAHLAGQGVPVAQPPTDQPFGRTFAVRDPAGHTVYFMQLPARG